MRNHLLHHIFNIGNLFVLMGLNFILPLYIGLDDYGSYVKFMSLSFLIIGLITFYLDLDQSRSVRNIFNDLFIRLVLGIILFTIIFIFNLITFPFLIVILVGLIPPVFLFSILKLEKTQLYTPILFVNVLLYIFWIIFWKKTGDFFISYIIRELLYTIFVIYISKSDFKFDFKLNLRLRPNYIMFSLIEQMKVWLPFIVLEISDLNAGNLKIQLGIAYTIVSLLPLNLVSLNLMKNNNTNINKIIVLNIIVFIVGMLVLILFRDLFNDLIFKLYQFKPISLNFFYLTIAYFLYRIISIDLLRIKPVFLIILILGLCVFFNTNFNELPILITLSLIFTYVVFVVLISKIENLYVRNCRRVS